MAKVGGAGPVADPLAVIERRSAPADVSVVICVYSRERLGDLTAAIESLRHQTLRPREIIVVVDHNPELLDRARAQLGGVVVLENSEQRGLSGARNSGIRAAHGEILAFIDDDAVADPDWLSQLTKAYMDPRVLGVGGTVEPLWATRRPAWFPPEYQWVVGCSYRGMPDSRAPVRNFIGCNMSFRRSVFESVGAFRGTLGRVDSRPAGCEETELCIRAHHLRPHSLLLFEPRSHVHHRVPTHRTTWTYFRARCYAEGRSKAVVSRLAGRAEGLASERAYTFRTLPRGVIRGLADAAFRGDATGLARASAIIAGLVFTTAGYVVGTLAEWTGLRSEESAELAGQEGAA